jgi:hypothetical protein
MPGPNHGYLLIKDRMGGAHELLNNARTASYLANPDLAIDLIDICSIEPNGGCDSYAYMPNCGPGGDGSWSALQFDRPESDPAPWYNSLYPQSADALGFIVEDWTGLDDGHIRRSTTAWDRGHSLGPLGSSGRVMKINVFLFGRTEEATEYLFRWLGSTLSSVCSTCASESILIRRFCGDVDNLWDGIAEMRRVGLVEGLRWENEPIPLGDGSCYFRRASFALQAGDPCMYLPEQEVPPYDGDVTANISTCLSNSPTDPEREFCRPICAELANSCRTSYTFDVSPMAAMAPVVTFTNSSAQHNYPFRAIVYYDPYEMDNFNNPCGLQILGEIYVRPLPPSSALRWDVTGRQVEFRDPSTGGFTSGWAYIDANDPPRQKFFALPCGHHHLILEPASLCADFVSGTTWTLDGITYVTPTFPTTQILLSERMSCP